MEKLNDNHKIDLSTFIKSVSRTAEELKRAQAVLLLAEGASESTIITFTGLKRTTAVKIRKLYIKHGISALESKKKDKKAKSLLTKTQREEIAVILHTKTPRNYGWEWDYWTPSILGKLILELYAVQYKSKTSLYLIFKRSKFTYHKPDKIYARRNQAIIDAWKIEHKSTVEEALKDPDTVLLVADEMILSSQTTTQKIWLPEGKESLITCSNTRKRRSIYGFLNIKTGTQHAFKTERQTSAITAKLLEKLCNTYKEKKIVLYWDNAPWHKGDPMRKFLTTCTNLTVKNFPPYAPDLNPQEHVWKAGRTHVTHNTFISDIDKTTREFLEYLNNSTFKYEFYGFTAS
ncbi:MAG TPA: IS630 family transposase [Candidatus Babeliales bacterium]|jgi:transposase|nr:IS630 family transposase [Candidatus Babeliales bacterium]